MTLDSIVPAAARPGRRPRLRNPQVLPKPGGTIVPLRASSRGPEVILVKGFLQQWSRDFDEWMEATAKRYGRSRAVGYTWGSRGGEEQDEAWRPNGAVSGLAATGIGLTPGVTAALRAEAHLLKVPLSVLIGLFINWLRSVRDSEAAGAALVPYLAAARQKRHTLIGHSLGARLAFSALDEMAGRGMRKTQDVYLLGAALGPRETAAWRRLASCVHGRIYNVYSRNDWILKYGYPLGSFGDTPAVGTGPIERPPPGVINVDATDVVGGHSAYVRALPEIFELARRGRRSRERRRR